MDSQFELEFGSSQSSAGYDGWVAQRKRASLELGKKLNLPIGHAVEVWLKGGIRLRGVLHLSHDILVVEDAPPDDLRFRVDGVEFALAEMESFVRMD